MSYQIPLERVSVSFTLRCLKDILANGQLIFSHNSVSERSTSQWVKLLPANIAVWVPDPLFDRKE